MSRKVHLIKVIVFPVVMYGCESWTIKKAECWRIDAFELWCWRRLLRVPWTAKRSNQFILKETSPEYSLKDWCWSWNSNTLATWFEELTHWKTRWCWERLKAGGEGEDRGWDGWMASPTRWTWVWASSGSWWWTGRHGVLQSMGSQRVRHNWTELKIIRISTESSHVPFPSFPQGWHLTCPQFVINYQIFIWFHHFFTGTSCVYGVLSDFIKCILIDVCEHHHN